jgi:hypothetical protein
MTDIIIKVISIKEDRGAYLMEKYKHSRAVTTAWMQEVEQCRSNCRAVA